MYTPPEGYVFTLGAKTKKLRPRNPLIHLHLAALDSLLLSPLCRQCPQGRAGCCAAPPAIAWADIGRIVLLGGRDFLLDEMRAQRLAPNPRGLVIRRVPESDGFPARCTYLGKDGCILPPARRSATCNYYLCEDAYVLAESEGDPFVTPARQAHERIAALLGQWDLELSALVTERFPDGPPWDETFFDWIGAELARLQKRSRRALKPLEAKTSRT